MSEKNTTESFSSSEAADSKKTPQSFQEISDLLKLIRQDGKLNSEDDQYLKKISDSLKSIKSEQDTLLNLSQKEREEFLESIYNEFIVSLEDGFTLSNAKDYETFALVLKVLVPDIPTKHINEEFFRSQANIPHDHKISVSLYGSVLLIHDNFDKPRMYYDFGTEEIHPCESVKELDSVIRTDDPLNNNLFPPAVMRTRI